MKNLKLYIGAGIVILIASLAVWGSLERKGRLREKADRERNQYNTQQLLSQGDKYQKITQTIDEFKRSISGKMDSILEASKIKPKQVTNIIERHYIYRDTSFTTITPEAIETNSVTTYPFIDSKDCFKIKGFMTVKEQRPSLTITERKFENPSIDIAYIEREKKFWFIRYGRWRAKLKQINTCEGNTTREIQVIKNR